jgi:hypothetical protein
MTTREYKIGEIVACPMSDRVRMVIGYQDGIPITRELSSKDLLAAIPGITTRQKQKLQDHGIIKKRKGK